jgi:hypothetical protein
MLLLVSATSGGASQKILWGQSAYVESECILRQDLYTNMYILKRFSKKAVGSADPIANTQLRRCLVLVVENTCRTEQTYVSSTSSVYKYKIFRFLKQTYLDKF